jgi:outer membrane lipoprotein-sorting protein
MAVKLNRRARWAVPSGAVVVTAAVVAGLQIPAAQASPDLPAKTPAQLLASLSSDQKVPPMTGTVVETASLGLPSLPTQDTNPTSLTSLLTGSHTVKVYYQDSSHFRLSIPQPQAETDIIANGAKTYLWESASDSVTEFNAPAHQGKPVPTPVPSPTQTPLTPQQAANQILAKVGKTTLVSVQSNVMVAGEPAYQLVLAPKDTNSLVGKIVIALDGKYGVPLQVELYAKGATSPAFQVGYQSLQWVTPSPANFDFTPPKDASVTVENLGQDGTKSKSGSTPATSGFGSYGKNWLTVVSFPQSDLMQGLGAGGAIKSSASSANGQSDIISANNQGVSVSSQELLNALFGSGKTVSGSWGTGTLVSTSLVSMLITNGEVYVGAVTPSVLYAAVGHTSSAG